MTRDGRSFDHRTLEAIRLMAVERVREGERPSSVVASFGFSRTTIYKWLKAASTPGMGLKALRSRPATGRPRTLTPRQERQVFRWINGRDPRQYGLDFGHAFGGGQPDRAQTGHQARRDRGRRFARQAGADAAKAAAAGLSARSRRDRAVAARAVPCHCPAGPRRGRRGLVLG